METRQESETAASAVKPLMRAEGSEMLVLSRKLNQSIMIGDDIELTIVDVKGDQVRIGICLLYTSDAADE